MIIKGRQYLYYHMQRNTIYLPNNRFTVVEHLCVYRVVVLIPARDGIVNRVRIIGMPAPGSAGGFHFAYGLGEVVTARSINLKAIWLDAELLAAPRLPSI